MPHEVHVVPTIFYFVFFFSQNEGKNPGGVRRNFITKRRPEVSKRSVKRNYF